MPAKKPDPRRKNARRYDTDEVNSTGTIISSRVSDAMLERIKKAMTLMGRNKRSEIINVALILLLADLPEIVEMYHRAGIIPKNTQALKLFMTTPRAPEEIEYMRQHYPEKVASEIAAYKAETLEKLRQLEERLLEVERTQRRQALAEPPKPTPMGETDLELA
jgi:hypothetical protein